MRFSDTNTNKDQTIVRDGSLFGIRREFDGREQEVIKAVEAYKLDREEQKFVERGVNQGVYEHPSNVPAMEAAVRAGAQTAVATRGQDFRARKDAVEIAAARAAEALIKVRSSDFYR